MEGVLTVAVVLAAYAALSGPLDRRGVTSAMAFVAVGAVVGTAGLDWLTEPVDGAAAERVTELALAFLLFTDAARIDLRSLRRSLAWPSRLLLVGLPLTMVLGLLAALLVFPQLPLASAFVLATMLCSTDAALGQRVVEDEAVPARVRQALDVESGLNDGLAVPFFLVAVDLALATLHGGVGGAVLHNVADQIGWGVAAGVGVGAVGGALLRLADGRGWLTPQWRQLCVLALAAAAYAAAVVLGGSGFIGAFVGGLAFGAASRQRGLRTTYLAEEVGSVLAAVTWLGFGALALSAVWSDITWRVVVYALLSLTVIRMLPVAVALLGSGARWPTVAFMGWFGPRGLASVVFGLLALEEGVPDADTLLTTVVVTVGLSVFLHGLTATPLVAVYHRWYAAQPATESPVAEAAPTPLTRTRGRPGPGDAG
ncbi:cation:proton antiporter [Nocardioides sp.]|uniref:cation:proton antiporter domain-containing protein n=1 Tax=Nocardioides sp. TaxID=35761 RepID=UPI00378463DB